MRVYEQAAAGGRRIVLLSGEPGIGKTRLAAEVARRAHAAGAIALHGRCDAEALLAYQPFAEGLRHYVHACPPAILRDQLGGAGELQRIVPELAERVPELREPLPGDPEGARHRLFEAVASLLGAAAQLRPLVLVLEDLHWADPATLLLLKYLARHPAAARLMVLGTYREMDVEPGHPFAAVLLDLARERRCERLALAPLCLEDVAELVAAHAVGDPRGLASLLLEETGGNAFFVVEMLRHLAESGALAQGGLGARAGGRLPLPDGVRDLIGQRLARLGPRSGRVLATASVLGRDFRFELLEQLCELEPEALADALEPAIRAQVIEESARDVGRYAFAHALIREVLYSSLTTMRRALLHRRAAAAIEQSGDARLDARLAHHLARSGTAEDLERAVGHAARAGARAGAQLAYEQAGEHLREAIELLDRLDVPERDLRRCELTIAWGEAARQAGDPAYREILLAGARIAMALGDGERLARAALANTRGFLSSSQGVDHERVAVLRAALEALGDGDGRARAGVLAQLAIELIAEDDWRPRARLGDAALAMARRDGDPATLARALTQRAVARWNPDTLRMRSADLLEAWRLARGAGEHLLAGHAAYFGFHTALEAGDVELADRLLGALDVVVERLGQPILAWYGAVAHAKRGVVTGSPREAERLAFAAHERGTRAGQPDAVVWFLGQLFAARFLQGTLGQGEPNLALLFTEPGSGPEVGPEFTPARSIPLLVGAAMSATCCEVGRLDDGRRHFEALAAQLSRLPNDYATLAILAQAAVACTRLGDTRRAELLHELLEPYGDQFVNTGTSWFGAVAHHLAILRATVGDATGAAARFSAAERAYERLGAAAWLKRCRADRARAGL